MMKIVQYNAGVDIFNPNKWWNEYGTDKD